MSNKFSTKNGHFNEKLTMNLAKVGKQYKILSCSLPNTAKTRLYEMGLVPETIFTVLKKAPAGDPMEIAVRGYTLCLRAKDAQSYVVSEVEK